MPAQAFIIIFLLFFAVLAFGWFYWQRAKTRDAAKDMGASSETTPPSSSDQA